MEISVVIPLYNKVTTIERALKSVFSQTLQPLEILVVDDGSTDGSEQIVENLNHPLIRLINQKNAGVSAARNKGIEVAKGEWIAFLDADDIWKSQYLETIYGLNQSYPQASVLATAYDLQDFLGISSSIVLNKLPFTGQQGLLSNYFEVASCSHPPLCSSAITVKKDALILVDGFPLGVKSGEDLLTWAKLAVKFQIAYCLKPMAVFIQDPAHTYDDKPNRIPQEPDVVGRELVLLKREGGKIKGLSGYISHWFKMRGSIYLRLGMGRNAMKEIIKGLYFNPLNVRLYQYLILLVLPLRARKQIFKMGAK